MKPNIKNFNSSGSFFLIKWNINKIDKIIKIYDVGVCIERNAKKHIYGNKYHKNLFLFFIAISRLKVANNEKM